MSAYIVEYKIFSVFLGNIYLYVCVYIYIYIYIYILLLVCHSTVGRIPSQKKCSFLYLMEDLYL
jgi:hypothetical protein